MLIILSMSEDGKEILVLRSVFKPLQLCSVGVNDVFFFFSFLKFFDGSFHVPCNFKGCTTKR
jgi:hypothetical protein